ncbi:family 1 glycosylhydrolase [Paenibacillus sp. sptzw28]|uniref:family 1 glycosylhydrolase n=1 Tax=Paenibacillus sp. sptzw28 TaxID=715179 RepID=UPI002163CECB|nr:family 1 glycosylhydrolase [Paenibacillus sp. sptzw28]
MVQASQAAAGGRDDELLQIGKTKPRGPVTALGWEIHAASLYKLLTRVQRDYTGELPLFITENGAAMDDECAGDKVADPRRIEYVHQHLAAAHRFIREGGPLAGYYFWSFMDNFEWAFGYDKRFGMVYVDYETQKRTVKDSAYWYRDVIGNNGVTDLPEIFAEQSGSVDK